MVINPFIHIPGAAPQAVFYDPFRVWFTGSKADIWTTYLIKNLEKFLLKKYPFTVTPDSNASPLHSLIKIEP